jgi:hypothetical protein
MPLPRGWWFAPLELGSAVENLVPVYIPKSGGQAMRTREDLASPAARVVSALPVKAQAKPQLPRSVALQIPPPRAICTSPG